MESWLEMTQFDLRFLAVAPVSMPRTALRQYKFGPNLYDQYCHISQYILE